MNRIKSLTKPITIAVIADVHYGTSSSIPIRRSEIADILLMRAVRRLNRLICPDITLILGDILDDGKSCDAEKNLLYIRSILDKLDTPYIAIPGNHDSDAELFYQTFDRPKDVEDICGVRFLSFVDQEEPNFNARRNDKDLARLHMARNNYSGPIVALQHVCLFPPGQSTAPYNYTNATEIITAMKESDVLLSVSGHHHPGAENVRNDNTIFVNVSGLCEAPFPFTVIQMDHEQIQTQRHELSMPEHLRLVDNHVHTQLAYCSENMTVENAISLSNEFGLAGITFTEHSGQLYFDEKRYWDKTCFQDGIGAATDADNRMANYVNMKRIYEHGKVRFGLEVDCDYQGNLLLRSNDRVHFDHIMGALHNLSALKKDTPPRQSDHDEFLFLLERLLSNRIDVLAHPFRVFRRSGWAPPAELFKPTAQLLRKYNTAAEINVHINEPPIEFIRTCLDLGVKFSFGSDAHHLSEIGDFTYHLALLKDAGFNGDLTDILNPRRKAESSSKCGRPHT